MAELEIDAKTGKTFNGAGGQAKDILNAADQSVKTQNPELRNQLAHDDTHTADYISKSDGSVAVALNGKEVARVAPSGRVIQREGLADHELELVEKAVKKLTGNSQPSISV
jgi:hypothetical protein